MCYIRGYNHAPKLLGAVISDPRQTRRYFDRQYSPERGVGGVRWWQKQQNLTFSVSSLAKF